MRTIYISVLAIFGLFIGSLTVLGQQIDLPSLEIDAGRADTETTDTVQVEIISMDLKSTEPLTVGGDGEDIGDKNEADPRMIILEMSDGSEREDIGAPASDESDRADDGNPDRPVVTGIEYEDIGIMPKDTETASADMFLKMEGVDGESESTIPDDEIMVLLRPAPGADGTEEEVVRMNKSDLIEAITNSSDGGLRGGFMKIADIKGEADDTASSDGLDLDSDNDGVGEAKSSKPREIIVVGSKVRNDNVPQIRGKSGKGEAGRVDSFFDIWVGVSETKNARPDSFFDIFVDIGERTSRPDSFFDIFVDVSDVDLELHAVSVAQSDDTIKEIELTREQVRVDYTEKMRLFGVFPITSTRTVIVNPLSVDKFERVKVKFPWWHIFASKDTDPDALRERIDLELDLTIPDVPDTDDRPTEEVAFYYNKLQAQTLQTISNVSKTP